MYQHILVQRFVKMLSIGLLIIIQLGMNASAKVMELFPGDNFEIAAESLQAGDTLILHAGIYQHQSRLVISVKGTLDLPVIIKGVAGESRPIISLATSGNNVIDIDGASYLTIQGLEITSNNIAGADGINMKNNPSHITLEDLEIHDVSVGINFRSSMHHITVRRNHIHHTNDTGEGLYVGCHDGSCAVTDSLIEHNWIHDTRGADQGDGIEIKRGSHSNIIRDNVIHDTKYPCIILYGTEGNPQNVVERNVMWSCDDSGIQAAADAIIRNNIIILDSGTGFNSQPHAGVTPNNLQVINNTIIGGSPCLRINAWEGKTDMIFANNAVYCISNDYAIGQLDGVRITGNVVEYIPPGFPATGYTLGRSEELDFIDAGTLNFYLSQGSPLIDAGDSNFMPTDDFNGTIRKIPAEAGAYTKITNENPGWKITPGIKDTVTLNISPSPPINLVVE